MKKKKGKRSYKIIDQKELFDYNLKREECSSLLYCINLPTCRRSLFITDIFPSSANETTSNQFILCPNKTKIV